MADELQANLSRFLELISEYQHSLPPDLLMAALELGAALNRRQRENAFASGRLTGAQYRLPERQTFSPPYPRHPAPRRREVLPEGPARETLVSEPVH